MLFISVAIYVLP